MEGPWRAGKRGRRRGGCCFRFLVVFCCWTVCLALEHKGGTFDACGGLYAAGLWAMCDVVVCVDVLCVFQLLHRSVLDQAVASVAEPTAISGRGGVTIPFGCLGKGEEGEARFESSNSGSRSICWCWTLLSCRTEPAANVHLQAICFCDSLLDPVFTQNEQHA